MMLGLLTLRIVLEMDRALTQAFQMDHHRVR